MSSLGLKIVENLLKFLTVFLHKRSFFVKALVTLKMLPTKKSGNLYCLFPPNILLTNPFLSGSN